MEEPLSLTGALITIGINAVSYALFSFIGYSTKKATGFWGALSTCLVVLFFLCSVPFCGVLYFVDRLHTDVAYKEHLSDMRKLRFIASCQQRPDEVAINLYDLDVSLFDRSWGEFDIEAWKAHEYKKLGV